MVDFRVVCYKKKIQINAWTGFCTESSVHANVHLEGHKISLHFIWKVHAEMNFDPSACPMYFHVQPTWRGLDICWRNSGWADMFWLNGRLLLKMFGPEHCYDQLLYNALSIWKSRHIEENCSKWNSDLRNCASLKDSIKDCRIAWSSMSYE